MAAAEKRFAAGERLPGEGSPAMWSQACSARMVIVEFDDNRIIQSVGVSLLAPQSGDCTEKRGNPMAIRKLITGRGLALDQSRDRVLALYGQPAAVVPATDRDREFELLFYAFDWAGPDVPQVMEIICDLKTRRVVKITLASQSL